MITPYTTKSGLQIGCNYQPTPKPLRMSRTETMLQTALLKVKPRKQSKLAKPVTERPTDWDGIGIAVGSIAILVIAYAIGWLAI